MQKWEYFTVDFNAKTLNVDRVNVKYSTTYTIKVNGEDFEEVTVDSSEHGKGINLHRFLNRFGEQGWELFSTNKEFTFLIFKRPQP